MIHFKIAVRIWFDEIQIDSLDSADANGLKVGNVLEPSMEFLEMIQWNFEFAHEFKFLKEISSLTKIMNWTDRDFVELEVSIDVQRWQGNASEKRFHLNIEHLTNAGGDFFYVIEIFDVHVDKNLCIDHKQPSSCDEVGFEGVLVFWEPKVLDPHHHVFDGPCELGWKLHVINNIPTRRCKLFRLFQFSFTSSRKKIKLRKQTFN